MKTRGILTLVLVSLFVGIPLCFSDELRIPFSIKEQAFLQELKKHNLNFDGSDNADGLLKNYGQTMSVCTFKKATPEQLKIITDAAFKCVRKK